MIPATSITYNSTTTQTSTTPIHQSLFHGGPRSRPASLGCVSGQLSVDWICMGQPHLLQKRSLSDGMASQSGFAQGGSSKRFPQWGQNWAPSDTSLPQPLHPITPVGLFGGLRETAVASRSGGPDGGLCGGGGFLADFRARAITPPPMAPMTRTSVLCLLIGGSQRVPGCNRNRALPQLAPPGTTGTGTKRRITAQARRRPPSNLSAPTRGLRLNRLTIQSMPAPTSPPIRAPTIATPKIGTDPSYSPPNRAQMVQMTPMPPPATPPRIAKSEVSSFVDTTER